MARPPFGVTTWKGFSDAAPELAGIGLERFHKTGVALIGSIRQDGTPRISPCEVYVVDGELHLGMMWRSTKALDLLRDPRVLVHSTVCNRTGGYDEGEFKIRGRVVDVQDPAARDRYADVVQAAIDWRPTDPYHLFSVDIDDAVFVFYADEQKHVTRWTPAAGVQKSSSPG